MLVTSNRQVSGLVPGVSKARNAADWTMAVGARLHHGSFREGPGRPERGTKDVPEPAYPGAQYPAHLVLLRLAASGRGTDWLAAKKRRHHPPSSIAILI